MYSKVSLLWRRLTLLLQKEIWQSSAIRDPSLKGRSFAVLRIISITLTGLAETRAMSRAAALSFSTLLGLAPLIGIAVLVAGFAVGDNNTELVTDKLNELIRFVAPQLAHYEEPTQKSAPASPSTIPEDEFRKPGEQQRIAVNPQLVNLINDAIKGTRSATGGVVSTLSLIVVVLMLFTSVEQVFNDIWGVRRGRSWLVRLVSYWTILTLGAVLFFGAAGAMSATTFVGFFSTQLKDHFPHGEELAKAVGFLGPSLSFALFVFILALFYRFIPNTHVSWRAAVIGAAVVTLLVFLNNILAFSYFSRVDMQKSLYGSLALIPVLMFGLYVFWLFVLVGGHISYAVQNVHFRNSQAAWSGLSEFTRERLTLVVLLTIARRFQACLPPCTVSELGSTIRVPTQVLNECLNRLVDLKLISPIPPNSESTSSDYLYQPARPLNRITLKEFKHAFETFGHDPASEGIRRLDPLVEQYQSTVAAATDNELFTLPLDQLFAKYSFELGQVSDAPAPSKA